MNPIQANASASASGLPAASLAANCACYGKELD